MVHKEIKSPSGIIHGHLIALVKQAQMYLQSDQKRYEQIFTIFKKNILFSKFSTALLTHSLTDAFSQA